MADKRYTITTVRDLLAVPDEKLQDCLVDLHAWVLMVKAGEASKAVLLVRDSGRFVWVDDGKHVATITAGGQVFEHEFFPPTAAPEER